MRDIRVALLPLVAALLVVAAMMASSSTPERDRRPTTVAVTQSSYACPAGSTISVAAGQVTAGTSATTKVAPGGAPDPALQDAKSWRNSVVDGQGVIVQQQGTRSGAVGFFAGTATKQGGGGLVVGGCPGVVDDAWLLGLGSGAKHFSTLILTNLGDSPAAVDLSLWGRVGPIDAVDAGGIVVKPFSVRRIEIADLAAGEAELAIHVQRRRGSLSAVVNDSSTSAFRGTEPITATSAPRRSQVVGGIVEGTVGRTLLLLNPGKQTARVDAQVIGPKNTFAPSGLAKIKVPAGSQREIVVPRSAGSGSQALRLTSDRPVSATVRMAPDPKDYAYAESVPPLAGPAVVPVDVGKGIKTPDLVLTAPKGTATARLQAFDASMKPLASASVTVKGGTTQHVDTAKALKAKGVAYIVLRPRGDIVAAATYVEGGGRISSLALTAAPLTALGPQVRPVS
ncbi:DUF5719 family protein [Aeromicrobium sp.]|uniref:DUF5719 family protein n=1 Tax=Aeromicrobium sp. TaxID=1871063 RepID=UPI0019B0861C|nr:DUF5719 family protein [Aeromicrobium sp.]MBC7632020.1 hypothetical protein [Aeromicrobium sp.]